MTKLNLLCSTFLRNQPEGQSAAADGGIPDALKRNPDNSLPGSTTPAKEATKAQIAAARKAAKDAAKAAAKAKAKGKVVDAPHKKADIVATEANPQKSIVPVKFKTKYAEHDDSNGDRVAVAFKKFTTTRNEHGREACDPAKLAEVAKANGIDMGPYARLNIGMQRMNVGNRLRGMLKNEKTIVIGTQKFADWDKAKVVAPPAPKPEKPAKAAAPAA